MKKENNLYRICKKSGSRKNKWKEESQKKREERKDKKEEKKYRKS